MFENVEKYHGVYSIVSRNSKTGLPQVIQVLPIVKNRPFPTLYWLVCPILKKELSHIEATGLVKKFEREILKKSPDLLKSLYKDNINYCNQRIELFKKEFSNFPLSERMKKQIFETGIGGIRDYTTIKCLHLQYAYHLASGPTTVGAYLDHHFNMKDFI